MGEFLDLLKTKKTLIGLVILGILLLGLFIGRNLISQQQIIKSRASEQAATWYGCANWTSTMMQGTPQDKSCKQNNPDSVAWKFVCNACGTTGSSYEKKGECGSQCDSNGSGRLNSYCDWWSCQSITPPNAGPCLADRQSPDLGSACTTCIANNKPDVISSIRSFNHTSFDGCSAQKLVNFWCNGGVSPQASADCTREKSRCSSVCSATSAPPGNPGENCSAAVTGKPQLSATCATCIDTNKPGLVSSIKGLNPTLFASCNNLQLLSYWCSDSSPDVTLECNRLRAGTGVCASSCAAAGGPVGGKYIVSGTVFQTDGTTPAPGVTVEVWNDLASPTSKPGITNANGVFTVSDFIENGKAYAVRIPKTQTITKVFTTNDSSSRNFAGPFAGKNTPKDSESYEFQLTNDSVGPVCADKCNFKIEVSSSSPSPSPTTATIGGKVINASGIGVNGVKVWIRDEKGSGNDAECGNAAACDNGKYKSVITDAKGQFSSGQVTIGSHGYWVRIPDQVTLGDDGVNNVAIFTAKQATKAPFANTTSQSYEAQPFDNISHGCWNDCNFTVQLRPSVATVAFRVAESLTGFTESGPNGWQDYTAEGMIVDYAFNNTTPGVKFVFVEFKDSNGKVTTTVDCPKCQAQIQLLGDEPAITGCALGFAGNNTILNLTGDNFGTDKGTVAGGDENAFLQIKKWKNDAVSVVWPNAPTGQTLNVVLTNTAGQTVPGTCSASSQLALGAKVFCRQPFSHQTSNVDLILVEASEGAKPVRQKVSIDQDGLVQGLNQKLEIGKTYIASIKAPKSLRRNIGFTVEEGTINIPRLMLPVGDIFPRDGGDGVINSADKSELNKQFILTQDACSRTGDFNQDCRVNSVDYACMRVSLVNVAGNNQDDPEPVSGAAVQ